MITHITVTPKGHEVLTSALDGYETRLDGKAYVKLPLSERQLCILMVCHTHTPMIDVTVGLDKVGKGTSANPEDRRLLKDLLKLESLGYITCHHEDTEMTRRRKAELARQGHRTGFHTKEGYINA